MKIVANVPVTAEQLQRIRTAAGASICVAAT
jgi:hypothetical protein